MFLLSFYYYFILFSLPPVLLPFYYPSFTLTSLFCFCILLPYFVPLFIISLFFIFLLLYPNTFSPSRLSPASYFPFLSLLLKSLSLNSLSTNYPPLQSISFFYPCSPFSPFLSLPSISIIFLLSFLVFFPVSHFPFLLSSCLSVLPTYHPCNLFPASLLYHFSLFCPLPFFFTYLLLIIHTHSFQFYFYTLHHLSAIPIMPFYLSCLLVLIRTLHSASSLCFILSFSHLFSLPIFFLTSSPLHLLHHYYPILSHPFQIV